MDRTVSRDARLRPVVFITGPFPPPVHGMAVATERLAVRLATRFDLRRYDIAARRRSGVAVLNVLVRAVAALATLAGFSAGLLMRRPRAVIVAMSAGFAKLFDLLVIAIALVLGRKVYVTHHSFAVFDGRTRQLLLRVARPLLRRCRHIVLCEAMRAGLSEAWGLDPADVRVLSNAALMESAAEPPGHGRAEATDPLPATLRLGFIANLCADKGLWTFLDVVERARGEGIEVSALIAGPVEPADPQLEQELRDRLRRMPDVQWLGAVHGERRAAFYEAIDLLVFPTVYLHESEPLVILEALAHGVPVITTRRGCIASALADGAAVQALDETQFVAAATAAIQRCSRDMPRAERRRLALAQYGRLRAVGDRHWEQLVAQIEKDSGQQSGPSAIRPK
jgi:glycosyltransferase involved in cell wall biosynthesis